MLTANSSFVAPIAIVSPTDNSASLIIFNLIALIFTFTSIGVRVYTSNKKTGSGFIPFADDWASYISFLFCIIVFTLLWLSVKYGNGKAMHLISPSNLVIVQKFQYAIDLLYIVALFCSRASVVLLIQRLQGAHWNILWRVILAVLTAWAIGSVFAVALRGNLKDLWIEYNLRNTELFARWIGVESSGVVIECCVFAFLVSIIYAIQIPTTSKLKVIALFGTRTLVLVFAGLRISSLHNYYESSNPTYTGTKANIYLVAEMNASLITATTPLLKSFFLEFNVVGKKPLLFRKRRTQDQTPNDVERNVTQAPEVTRDSAFFGTQVGKQRTQSVCSNPDEQRQMSHHPGDDESEQTLKNDERETPKKSDGGTINSFQV